MKTERDDYYDDFPRSEDANDLKFFASIALIGIGALLGGVAGLIYWVF